MSRSIRLCGGGFSKVSQTHYGCSTGPQQRNMREPPDGPTVRQAEVEQLVIRALQERLMDTRLDSHFKCDTEVCGECLDGRAVPEALPRRGVEGPDHVVDVGIGVVSESGLSGKVAAKPAVCVLDRAALPWTVRIAEVGAQADSVGHCLVPGELAAVVVGDGAPRRRRQSAQLPGDGFGCEFGILAVKTSGERQSTPALLEEFCAQYTAHLNRLRGAKNASRGTAKRKCASWKETEGA